MSTILDGCEDFRALPHSQQHRVTARWRLCSDIIDGYRTVDQAARELLVAPSTIHHLVRKFAASDRNWRALIDKRAIPQNRNSVK